MSYQLQKLEFILYSQVGNQWTSTGNLSSGGFEYKPLVVPSPRKIDRELIFLCRNTFCDQIVANMLVRKFSSGFLYVSSNLVKTLGIAKFK